METMVIIASVITALAYWHGHRTGHKIGFQDGKEWMITALINDTDTKEYKKKYVIQIEKHGEDLISIPEREQE